MKNLVVLEDSLIRSMVMNPQFVAAFPCLQAGRSVASGSKCTPCARRRQQSRETAIMGNLKSCLAGLPGSKRAELKQLLNAKQVRIVYSSGKLIKKLTF